MLGPKTMKQERHGHFRVQSQCASFIPNWMQYLICESTILLSLIFFSQCVKFRVGRVRPDRGRALIAASYEKLPSQSTGSHRSKLISHSGQSEPFLIHHNTVEKVPMETTSFHQLRSKELRAVHRCSGDIGGRMIEIPFFIPQLL